MEQKTVMRFESIAARIKNLWLPDVDAVVGIATGGTVPASLIAYRLETPLYMMHLNYRAPDNRTQHCSPILLQEFFLPPSIERVLLVDDVSVSGSTLETAKRLLPVPNIYTLVMKGCADIVAFPELRTCVQWPWKTGVAEFNLVPR